MQPTRNQSRDADRKVAQRLLADLLILVVLLIPIAIFEFAVDPFRRGFFCDDETIRYPFRANTVTPVMLGLLAGLVPAVGFVAIEYWRFHRQGALAEVVVFMEWKLPAWLIECAKQMAYFGVGMVLTFDATELGKYTIGRLRPHFIAVCQPQLPDGSTCSDIQNQHRYIETYECAAVGFTGEDVRQARLSFPSGHSSLAVYAMLYLALYIQQRVRWRKSKLMRHFVQFVLLMLAWFTALSRIIDNWHHWSDVLAGSLLGVLGALITASYIAKIFKCSPLPILRKAISRQDTSTTLDEVITTPPPYTLDTSGSFSNGEYCTKV